MPANANPIFVAIDTPDLTRASALTGQLQGLVGGVKLGKEFFTNLGPQGVTQARGDLPLFLDLKFHDIPNTVAGAVRGAVKLRPDLLTIHAAGGRAMMSAAMEAAKDAADALGVRPPKIVAVTLLTSLGNDDLTEIGFSSDSEDQVVRLASLAQDCGVDGVVCSPREIERLRRLCGPDFFLVVPGIRPAGAASGDQKRVMGPRDALDAGADVLVIGRPITAAPDPREAAQKINDEIARA